MTVYRNEDLLGEAFVYPVHGRRDLAERVKAALASRSIVRIRGFPTSPDDLYHFGGLLSRPLRKPAFKADTSVRAGVLAFIGDVRVRADLPEERRLPTQDSVAIGFHTARSSATVRPRYFALLMANQGWTGYPPGSNGESLLVRLEDALAEYRRRYPAQVEDDLRRLVETPIAYKPPHVSGEAAEAPILFDLENGRLGFRFWQDLVVTMRGLSDALEPGYLAAIERLGESLDECPRIIELQMDDGDLLVLDNCRVAHARRSFVASRTAADGSVELSPRQIYSAHLT